MFIEHNPFKSRPGRRRKMRSTNEKHNASEQRRREKINNYIDKLSIFVDCKKKSTLSVLNATEDYIKRLHKEIEESEALFEKIQEEKVKLSSQLKEQTQLKV